MCRTIRLADALTLFTSSGLMEGAVSVTLCGVDQGAQFRKPISEPISAPFLPAVCFGRGLDVYEVYKIYTYDNDRICTVLVTSFENFVGVGSACTHTHRALVRVRCLVPLAMKVSGGGRCSERETDTRERRDFLALSERKRREGGGGEEGKKERYKERGNERTKES